jgi:hypothetical protein
MARRILNRKDLRADYDAAERRKDDEEESDEGVEDEEEQDRAETDEDGSEEAEEGPKPKKKKVEKAAKPRSRARASKMVRMRVVWGVFSNSNQCVATYEYPRRKEADEHAARLANEKRSTFFVQPVKEPIEEKKER